MNQLPANVTSLPELRSNYRAIQKQHKLDYPIILLLQNSGNDEVIFHA